MTQVVWTAAALANLRAIRAYVEQFHPRAAGTLAARLIADGNGLQTFPHRGRAVAATPMRELVSVHPSVIRYRIDGDVVVILRVRHSSRRPTVP